MVESFNHKMNELNEEKIENYEQMKKNKYVDMSALWEHEQSY